VVVVVVVIGALSLNPWPAVWFSVLPLKSMDFFLHVQKICFLYFCLSCFFASMFFNLFTAYIPPFLLFHHLRCVCLGFSVFYYCGFIVWLLFIPSLSNFFCLLLRVG